MLENGEKAGISRFNSLLTPRFNSKAYFCSIRFNTEQIV